MAFSLHPIPGDDHYYCGPAAIAAFTGKHPKKEVRAAVNRYRNRPATRGICAMYASEVFGVLRMMGLRCSPPLKTKHRPTLREYIASNPDFKGVLMVTGHFVAVADGMALDNMSMIARPVAVFPGNRKRVQSVIEVYPRPG